MTEAEREVPDLADLANQIQETMDQLDGPAGQTADAMSQIKNTILPLMKDLAESVIFALGDLEEAAIPVEISRAEAADIATLLQAVLHSNPGNADLAARVQAGLEALEQTDEPEGDDEDEETN